MTNGSRTATPRQRTLRGALDWSYDLLGEPEQTLFRRLSVFAGGFMLESAESVGAGDGIDAGEVLDLLSRLVEKSLVVVRAEAEDTPRYGMLEPLRQYAWARLEESGEATELRRAHANHYLKVVEAAEPELTGPQQRLWVEKLERDHDNLRTALSWSLERGEPELGLRLSGTFWRFWFARGYLSEGLRWLEQALAGSGSAPARVKALEGLGWVTQRQGDTERARAAYEEMLELSRELGSNENIATALNSLGMLAAVEGDNGRARALLEENLAVLWELEDEQNTTTTLKRFHVLGLLGILAINEEGDYARAVELWEEALALTREIGDTSLVGTMLSNLGYAVLLQGDYERAASLSEEALTFARELGSAGVGIVPESLVNLGLAARSRGDNERATASFREALTLSQEIGSKPSAINALEGMAGVVAALDGPARTARLWGAAEAAREVICVALPPCDRALHDPYLVDARFRLGEKAWEEALAEGRAMTLERAVEYALSKAETSTAASVVPERPSAGTISAPLARREREIAALVARGFTNRQIASELVVSARTVDNHVANILKKLKLRSREQVFVHMVEGYARESHQARQGAACPRTEDKALGI